jgi:hypothetical protein
MSLTKKYILLLLFASLCSNVILAQGGGAPPLPGQGQSGNQPAGGGTDASAGSGTTATIIAPIAITKAEDMNFGNIAAGAADGTVILAPSWIPSRTETGGVTLPTSVQGDVSAAIFSVTGHPNATYTIVFPSDFDLTSAGGTETMKVHSFTSDPTPTGTLSALGQQDLLIGATLDVSANQVPGTYTNPNALTITVAYN